MEIQVDVLFSYIFTSARSDVKLEVNSSTKLEIAIELDIAELIVGESPVITCQLQLV